MSDFVKVNEIKGEDEEEDLIKCGVCYDDFDENDLTNKPYTLFSCGNNKLSSWAIQNRPCVFGQV